MQESITLPIVRPESHRVHRRIREHDGMFFEHNPEPEVEQVVRDSRANDHPGLAEKLCTMCTVAEDLYPAQVWRQLLALLDFVPWTSAGIPRICGGCVPPLLAASQCTNQTKTDILQDLLQESVTSRIR